jgi:hypothetical protein
MLPTMFDETMFSVGEISELLYNATNEDEK